MCERKGFLIKTRPYLSLSYFSNGFHYENFVHARLLTWATEIELNCPEGENGALSTIQAAAETTPRSVQCWRWGTLQPRETTLENLLGKIILCQFSILCRLELWTALVRVLK